ncbi:hypothetical protein MIND_00833500 [Mycena indigotica]|uniref:Protein kinase domain-containing protein n=1 Tax=Mycena indigotica TaxID=2126181 RepID=A0A8H6SIA3_9AGAR|nr:uncharacterized protein MIND_00833500 [Mycena indigotica]KAF7298857.1 hypothetical protein MIND_00833500 [Mycena indigotica]
MSGSYDHLNSSSHNMYGQGNGSGYITPATRSKRRTSNWIKFGIPVLLLVIAGAVVGAVVATRSKKSSDAATSSTGGSSLDPAASVAPSAAASAKDAIGIFPTATNSLYMVPIYPSATNAAAFSSPTFLSAANSKASWPEDPFKPSNPDVLTVRTDRPRLIAPAYKWDALPGLIAKDPYMKAWNDMILKNASDYRAAPPVVYFKDGDSGILDNAREIKQRIKAFAYVYRMTKDTAWVDRTWEELQNAAGNGATKFGPDDDRWNAGHFLDTAELSAAFGIAYDWLYDMWSADQKTTIRDALIKYGLQPGVTQVTTPAGWWRSTDPSNTINGNWNCVCNSGLTLGSLAILGDDTTGVARQLLQTTVDNAKQACAQAVSTDGTWAETANYWYFGTTGHAEMSASLLSATGSHYGLLDVNKDFSKTGDFHMYVFGPTSLFNFGDHGPNKYSTTANAMMFYSTFYNQPQYSLFQRDQVDAAEPWSMFWYNPTVAGAYWTGKPLDHFFDNGVDQWGSMRSTWTDINALYVAIKSGQNLHHQTHNDLDAGDFVLDAMGTRWAGELGSGDYNSPNYFNDGDKQGADRWKYYRKMTEGQNTIMINQANQNLLAQPTIKFDSSKTVQGPTTVFQVEKDSTAFFTTDMTSAYFDASSVKRGVRLLNGRKQVLLQDEVTTDKTIQWRMHTNATVAIDNGGTSATLTIDDKTMKVQMLNAPSGAAFTKSDAKRLDSDVKPPVPDQENPGVTVLIISLPAGTYSLQVLFNPQWSGKTRPLPAQTSLPLLTDQSQLLELDPTQILPQTLPTIPKTGMHGSVTTAELNAARKLDEQYCRQHFENHVTFSTLPAILEKLGGTAFCDRFNHLKQTASKVLPGKRGLKQKVMAAFVAESTNNRGSPKVLLDPKLYIENTYWLSALAKTALPATQVEVMEFIPSQGDFMPHQQGYVKRRKYDAALRPFHAQSTTIFNVLVNIEYTGIDAPSYATNPLIGASEQISKYQQAITNAADLLTMQSTRFYIPTLSFHGRGRKAKLFVSILNQDRLEFTVVEDCFGSQLSTVSALLALFQRASLYELGFSPLFTYSFTTPRPEFSLGDAMPHVIHLPEFPEIDLTGRRLSQLRTRPFGRSTLVLEGVHSDPTKIWVIKLTFIVDNHAWREKIVLDALCSDSNSPHYVPKLVAWFTAVGSHYPTCNHGSQSLKTSRERPAAGTLSLPPLIPRHLEAMAFESPRDTRKLIELETSELIDIAIEIFLALLDTFKRHIIHRDVSSGNLLAVAQRILVIDWETGRIFESEPLQSGTEVTGTLDTMAVLALKKTLNPLPHDDVESAAYVLLKALTQGFQRHNPLCPPEWQECLAKYRWDNGDSQPFDLIASRLNLWDRNDFSTLGDTKTYFKKAGDHLAVKFIDAIFSMPLPVHRWNAGLDEMAATAATWPRHSRPQSRRRAAPWPRHGRNDCHAPLQLAASLPVATQMTNGKRILASAVWLPGNVPVPLVSLFVCMPVPA